MKIASLSLQLRPPKEGTTHTFTKGFRGAVITGLENKNPLWKKSSFEKTTEEVC